MKAVITGCRGQLGSQMLEMIYSGRSQLGKIPPAWETARVIPIGLEDLDLTDLAAVRLFVQAEKPDIVINNAAYTDVDGCETNQDAAFRVNALAPRNLAIACDEAGARLLHLSTDYVFPGQGTTPYREYDPTGPVSVYGRTKLAGETYVRQFCRKWFIVRTSWLYGRNGTNFVRTIRRLATERDRLDVVNDQRGNPTNAEDLAYHLLKIALTDEYGVYHCTGNGICSWYEFALAIISRFDLRCKIDPIDSNALNRPAKRPAWSALDHAMLRCTIGDNMRSWQDALNQYE